MPPENHTNKPVTQDSSFSERFAGLETLSVDPENAQIQSRAALETILPPEKNTTSATTTVLQASMQPSGPTHSRAWLTRIVNSRYLRSNTTIRLNPWFT